MNAFRSISSRRAVRVLALAAGGAVASSALAGGGEWNNAAGVGNGWSVGDNWGTGAAPASGDPASFSLAADYAVAFDAPAVASQVDVNAGGITFALAGQALTLGGNLLVADAPSENATLTLAGGTVQLAQAVSGTTGGIGRLHITGNTTLAASMIATGTGSFDAGGGVTVVSQGLLLADAAAVLTTSFATIGGSGSRGVATIDGAGTRLSASGRVNVGWSRLSGGGPAGVGLLHVDNGAAVSGQDVFIGSYGGSGRVTVSGGATLSSATSLSVGFATGGTGAESNGVLTLVGGGQAVAQSSVAIGAYSGAVGTVTVSGTGSRLSSLSTVGGFGILVGFNSGNGELEVSAGAQASASSNVYIGSYGGSGRATVHGPGARLTGPGALWVGGRYYDFAGGASTGALTVSGGGMLDWQGATSVGYFGATGHVHVDGAGSTLASSSLFIGRDLYTDSSVTVASSGSLLAVNGARIETGTTTIGVDGGDGHVTVTGSGTSWSNRGSFYIANDVKNDAVHAGIGSLSLADGATLAVGTTTSTSLLLISGGGAMTVASGASVSARNLRVDGVLAIDGGSVSLDGGATLTSGATLQLSLGATQTLRVAGPLDLGGATLELAALDGYTPVAGDTFVAIVNDSAAAIAGVFGSALPDPAGFDYVLYAGGQVRIDYDGGDGNDVTLTIVPEPATGSLAIGAASLLLKRRRRR